MVARADHDVMRYRRVLATVPAVCVPSTPSIPALSRSRSFAVIHSPSLHSAMRYQSGTFYFAERGTSHVAATSNPFTSNPFNQTLSYLTMGASEQKLVAQYRMFKVEIPG